MLQSLRGEMSTDVSFKKNEREGRSREGKRHLLSKELLSTYYVPGIHRVLGRCG